MLEVRQRVTQPTEGRLIYRPLQPVLASSIGQHPSPPAQRLLSPRSPFALPAPRGIAACGQFGPSRWVAAIGLGSLARARGRPLRPSPGCRPCSGRAASPSPSHVNALRALSPALSTTRVVRLAPAWSARGSAAAPDLTMIVTALTLHHVYGQSGSPGLLTGACGAYALHLRDSRAREAGAAGGTLHGVGGVLRHPIPPLSSHRRSPPPSRTAAKSRAV